MLKLMYITNEPEVARIAEDAGVDRIFVDLETVGKAQRQGGMDTVQSHHTVADVDAIRKTLTKSQLLVRVNPVYSGTEREIEAVLDAGGDILMLPYFKGAKEVETFLNCVRGRAKTMLLVETPEAVAQLEEILDMPADEYHIGLNDLHLGYQKRFLFELLTDGTVESIAKKLKATGKPWGFGGMAALDAGLLNARWILSEHIRLGSHGVILSRAFCDRKKIRHIEEVRRIFRQEVPKIREAEREYRTATPEILEENRRKVTRSVNEILEKMK